MEGLQKQCVAFIKNRRLQLVQGGNDRLGDSVFVPWKFHSGKRFEIIKPDSIGIVLGKEGTANPVLVTALEEAQDKNLVSQNFFDSRDLNLACR